MQPGYVQYAFGPRKEDFMPLADPAGSLDIRIVKLETQEASLRVRLAVKESAVYEVNLLSENLRESRKKYFQLQEGLVQLVMPVGVTAAGRYAFRIGRLQSWSTCLFCC